MLRHEKSKICPNAIFSLLLTTQRESKLSSLTSLIALLAISCQVFWWFENTTQRKFGKCSLWVFAAPSCIRHCLSHYCAQFVHSCKKSRSTCSWKTSPLVPSHYLTALDRIIWLHRIEFIWLHCIEFISPHRFFWQIKIWAALLSLSLRSRSCDVRCGTFIYLLSPNQFTGG